MQVKLLKINANGHPEEMDTAADDITLASFAVTGGGPALSTTGLAMANTDISNLKNVVFAAPTTNTINQTAGSLVVDNIMAKERENLMTTAGAISFPVIADVAGQVDAFRLPALAGVPSATPTTSGEGHLVWDSVGNAPYAWNGTGWQNLSLATEALSIQIPYVAQVAVAARDVVYVSSADNVSPALATSESQSLAVVGFAVASAAAAGAMEVQSDGVMSGFSGLTAGAVQFLSGTVAGALTPTPPTGAGKNVVKMGVAKSATSLQIIQQYLGKRA